MFIFRHFKIFFLLFALIVISRTAFLQHLRLGCIRYHKTDNGTLLYGVDNHIFIRHPIGWIKPEWPTPTTHVIHLTGWQYERLIFETRLFDFQNSTLVYRSWRKDLNTLEILFNIEDINDLKFSYNYVIQLYKSCK